MRKDYEKENCRWRKDSVGDNRSLMEEQGGSEGEGEVEVEEEEKEKEEEEDN